MASAEVKNQPETLERTSVIESEAARESLKISKSSVLSHSFEPTLSAIIEENGASMAKVSFTTYPQENRLDQLARPKVKHLEESIEKLENSNKNEMSERIMKLKMRLRELRGSEKQVHSMQGDKSSKLSTNSIALYNNLQSSLRKAAFELLVKQIIDKMPQLIVKMQHTRAEQTTPEMKALMDTLHATLIYYIGQPTQEHEQRVFNYLCFGLAKFIETIIENVHNNQQEDERIAQDEKSGKGFFPVAVQLARKAYIKHQ